MTKLQGLVDEFYSQGKLVGLGAAVVDGQWGLEIAVAGLRRADRTDPLAPHHRWHLGSNAKPITALLCARLVERGVLDWRTTVADVLDDSAKGAREYVCKATLADFLSHRSGVRDSGLFSWMRQARRDRRPPVEQRAELARRLVTRGSWNEPSNIAKYSNYGYCIVAALLERLTGKSWEDLMIAEVFAPLGLQRAGFGAPGADGSPEPWGHSFGFFRPRPRDPAFPASDFPAAMRPAGAIHMDLQDWAAFARVFFASGAGSSVISPATVDTLTAPLATMKDVRTAFRPAPYAMGWVVLNEDWAQGKLLVHAGSNLNFVASIHVAPSRNLAFLIATNTSVMRGMGPIEKLRKRLVAEYGQASAPGSATEAGR
jgi:CubicO group peptidase (beta-lactamase class C family)